MLSVKIVYQILLIGPLSSCQNPYFQVMKFFGILLLLFLAACTLNADQEKSLNDAVNRYLSARNNNEILSYVAMTNANAVKYYKNQGDSTFKLKFGAGDEFEFIQDGNIRDTEASGSKIQVKYSFLKITGDLFAEDSQEIFIYAISEDNGVSWTFIDEADYLNDEIFTNKMRLIK